MRPFHLAIAINDVEETRAFYTTRFDVEVGREAKKWIDFNFYGHQLSAHVKPEETSPIKTNGVDGKQVPVKHFGIVLEWQQWHRLADKLKSLSTVFIIEPYIRFEGDIGEQATMFLQDPSGNALEFKSFKDDKQLFAK
ncbi:VOC family protein [Agaribacter marinus]|uniref:Glyoxalase n=1 Tax=Agaribacter marinus TaxID=1431249 RepID=A0AA37T4S9_9ALTE|nr:VOC family protein [Agaribacter marinus]GLR72113.1 glyoxalase [Agaribacter marinus]